MPFDPEKYKQFKVGVAQTPQAQPQQTSGGFDPAKYAAFKSGGISPPSQEQQVATTPTQQEQAKLPVQEKVEEQIPEDPSYVDKSFDDMSAELGTPAPEIKPSGGAQAVAALASGAVAEPVAGIAGIIEGFRTGDPNKAAQAVKTWRDKLTIKPSTQEGAETLQKVGKVVEPIGKAMQGAEKFLGDTVMEKTNSPALAALGATVPTLITELLGVGMGKGALKTARATKKSLRQGKIAKSLDAAAPDLDDLKTVRNELYKELDDSGAVLKQDSMDSFVNRLDNKLKGAKMDPRITPEAVKAFEEIKTSVNKGNVTTSELDTLRQIVGDIYSKSNLKNDKRLAGIMTKEIDKFMDALDEKKLTTAGTIDPKLVGTKYKAARELHKRVIRTEAMERAFNKAKNAAGGFEKGIVSEFRKILNNDNKKRMFTKEQLNAMKQVTRGKRVNLARMIGKLGIDTSLGGIAKGSLSVSMLGGTTGMIVPAIGTVSRALANRMTRKGAAFADSVIRAGDDGQKIVAAYMKHTPKARRSPKELSELLLRPDIALDKLPPSAFIDEAADIARENRKALAGGVAGGTALQNQKEQ